MRREDGTYLPGCNGNPTGFNGLKTKMSVADVVMTAARAIAKEGVSLVAFECLVIRAWYLEKQIIGLKGFETICPDSNKVSSTVNGRKGLVARGRLVKVGPKLYSVPEEK